MNDDVSREYHRLENQFRDILRSQKDIARKVLSSYLGLLTAYPDMPYDQKPVVHPITGDDLVVPTDMSSFEELHEKDEYVLDLVGRKTQEGGRVLIYTSWTRIDTQEKLAKLLGEQGYRVAVLTTAVPPNKREEWVERQVQSGIQVLICNPSLVETGLDLNDFTTIVYYNISYNLFTLRQSSRRSWRINQLAPRVELYFLYYEGAMQHRAIRLMASKLAVAGVIEGSNFSDEGLAAMSDCQDMSSALARELTQGIQHEVENLSDVFKKMAILRSADDIRHTVPEVIDVDDVIEGTAIVVDDMLDDVASIAPFEAVTPMQDSAAQSAEEHEVRERPVRPTSSGLLSLLRPVKPNKAAKKKTALVCNNQLSLFDVLAETA